MSVQGVDDGRHLLASVRDLLSRNGASAISNLSGATQLAGVYEDVYSFIGVAWFSSVQEMAARWASVQEELWRVAALAPGRLGVKAWDGYLVLITPEAIPTSLASEISSIRSDTRRLRKIVLTGDDIDEGSPVSVAASVRRALTPILPIMIGPTATILDPVATLPARLAPTGIGLPILEEVVAAYRRGEPMVQALHRALMRESE